MVWIVKKGISCLLILLGVTFVTFALMYLAGGDAISYFYENQGTAVSQEIMDAMRKKYGLDQPFLLQYGHWLLHALTGDMGESYVSGRAVLPLIASKIPHTLYLAAVSIALTLVVSIPLGVFSAVRKDGWCDSLAGGLSFLGNAMPNFFVAILLIYLLAVKLQWFPAVSVGRSTSVALPAVTLAIAMSAKYTRQIRGVVLAELRKALSCLRVQYQEDSEEFSMGDIFAAGLTGRPDSSEKRARVGALLGIGYGNGKQFLKRLNHFGITRSEWEKAFEACQKEPTC